MSNYEAVKYNFDGASLTGIEGTKTGTIVSWSSSSIPTGFLECDGSNVSRTTYADLFAEIGTTYGSGDGSSTFGLPDLQNNVAVGKSNNKTLASTGGANTVTSTGNISGSTANATLSNAQLANHEHGGEVRPSGGVTANANYRVSNTGWNFSQGGNPYFTNEPSGSSSGHSHNMSANFTGDSTSVVQPYIALIFIIKT